MKIKPEELHTVDLETNIHQNKAHIRAGPETTTSSNTEQSPIPYGILLDGQENMDDCQTGSRQ